MRYLWLFFLLEPLVFAWDLSSVLKAKSSRELQELLDQDQKSHFLKKMCQKERENKKIPVSCYRLGLNDDALCLSLELSDLRNLPEIVRALQSQSLSIKCRQYLKEKQELLQYREKDFLVPELKNYWTDKKSFF